MIGSLRGGFGLGWVAPAEFDEDIFGRRRVTPRRGGLGGLA